MWTLKSNSKTLNYLNWLDLKSGVPIFNPTFDSSSFSSLFDSFETTTNINSTITGNEASIVAITEKCLDSTIL